MQALRRARLAVGGRELGVPREVPGGRWGWERERMIAPRSIVVIISFIVNWMAKALLFYCFRLVCPDSSLSVSIFFVLP